MSGYPLEKRNMNKRGVADQVWHLSRPTRASQDLHRGENDFLDLYCHLNRASRASHDLHRSAFSIFHGT